ncbi:MAG: T9SS type A sorting domain-containing protein [Ignavibacteriaceae bacterium]|nr:T9SS type A sorting domain-containing protein [Ignavibacteriaceae bacterium]
MNNKILTLFLALMMFLLVGISKAQTFLDHNTGQVVGSVFNNGYFGHRFDGTQGSGFKYSTFPDAMFTAGIMLGTPINGIHGMVGSFTDGTNPLIQDMQNTVAFSGFTSNANFNQIAQTTYVDANASPYPVSVVQKSYSNTGDNYIFITYTITNTSGSQTLSNLRVGMFADWDVGLSNYLQNRGGMDLTRNLVYQWLQTASNDPNYYGLVALDGLSGGTVTGAFPGDANSIRNVIYDWISAIYDTAWTVNDDYRSFVGSGPYNLGPGQSVMVSFAVVVGTNLADLQAKTDQAQAKYNNFILPVELTSFTANSTANGNVIINWTTATELNNHRFEIERKTENSTYTTIGFVNGHGTTTIPQEYSYVDKNLEAGKYYYRLKQFDFDGSFSYSDEIMVDVNPVASFRLDQNYPNPFNPGTSIKFGIPSSGQVKLSVFNLLGQQVKVLVNEFKETGIYDVKFDAANLSSGIYMYRLEHNGSTLVRKMILKK